MGYMAIYGQRAGTGDCRECGFECNALEKMKKMKEL
jgi:hypothetical protein